LDQKIRRVRDPAFFRNGTRTLFTRSFLAAITGPQGFLAKRRDCSNIPAPYLRLASVRKFQTAGGMR
jgi:hypothetical protein